VLATKKNEVKKYSDIENLIIRLEKLQNSAWDYVYSLKNPKLTYGFENKYGVKMRNIIDILHSKEYLEDFKEYCKVNTHWNVGITVADLMC
jgi:hypothetical protein